MCRRLPAAQDVWYARRPFRQSRYDVGVGQVELGLVYSGFARSLWAMAWLRWVSSTGTLFFRCHDGRLAIVHRRFGLFAHRLCLLGSRERPGPVCIEILGPLASDDAKARLASEEASAASRLIDQRILEHDLRIDVCDGRLGGCEITASLRHRDWKSRSSIRATTCPP